ncbi:hypothetical protein PS15m_004454 [Mucor circinelloides]
MKTARIMEYRTKSARYKASRSCNVEVEFYGILDPFKSLDAIKKNLCDLSNIERFREISKEIPTNNKWRLVAEILAAIEKQQQDLYANDCRTKVKNKKLPLDLGNGGALCCRRSQKQQNHQGH